VNFVRRLFEFEVAEIGDRTVEIASIAREAGYRTKVAVHSADEESGPGGCLRGPAWKPREEHRPRAEQREGGHHRLVCGPGGVHQEGARTCEGAEHPALAGQKDRPPHRA
jgi:hypothetical protein